MPAIPLGRRSRAAAAATRERVLDSARQLIHARGVHAVTLDHVARAIGMTRGAIYVHFRSRAELLGALLTGAEADLEMRMAQLALQASWESHPRTPLEQVLGALLHDGGLACHASLLWALLQHKCTDHRELCPSCPLCPLRMRILRRAARLRRKLATQLPDARHASLLMAHLWGVLSAQALQLVPASGLDACAGLLARLYGAENSSPAQVECAVAAIAEPVALRDVP